MWILVEAAAKCAGIFLHITGLTSQHHATIGQPSDEADTLDADAREQLSPCQRDTSVPAQVRPWLFLAHVRCLLRGFLSYLVYLLEALY